METAELRTHGSRALDTAGELADELRRTPRVLGILYELFDNRYMHSGHLKALDGGAKMERLLSRMRKHGLITWLNVPWEWNAPPVGGQAPRLYELAPRGAYDITAAGMISEEQLREWERERTKRETRRAQRPLFKPVLLPHQIANADVTVWFHQGCSAHGYELEHGYQLAHGRSARVLTMSDGSEEVTTDNTFRISTRSGRRVITWIETDRTTEPYARLDKRDQRDIAGMFKGYLAYVRSGFARAQFGSGDFYQLTVTTGGASRVEGIARTANAVGIATEYRDRFLVTNFDALRRAPPFAVPWMDATGSIVRLRL